jgi:hypothetical protein
VHQDSGVEGDARGPGLDLRLERFIFLVLFTFVFLGLFAVVSFSCPGCPGVTTFLFPAAVAATLVVATFIVVFIAVIILLFFVLLLVLELV